jgi:hypothetical protein
MARKRRRAAFRKAIGREREGVQVRVQVSVVAVAVVTQKASNHCFAEPRKKYVEQRGPQGIEEAH